MTKVQSVEVFQQLGITMSDAVNMFLRQSILHGGLPFELKIPRYNNVTLDALADLKAEDGEIGEWGFDVGEESRVNRR
jgi:DNA-damage-inducible protein J